MNQIKKYWYEKAGAKELLIVAVPMVISTIAWTIQHFVDRMFLTWYSTETIAAAMPAGMLHFSLICIFLGIAGYVNVFVAQYHGAGDEEKFGKIIWQGIYVSIFGSLLLLLIYPFSDNIFCFIGHDSEIIGYEVVYFRILLLASFPMIYTSAVSGFYSGRGLTTFVMMVNVVATLINIILDFIMIFGKFGFPEMGIKGAALATAFAYVFAMVFYTIAIFSEENRRKFRTLADIKFDVLLFKKLLKFGFPNGIQFFLDMFGFSFFILMIGRLGTAELVASNIAININNITFMPLVGISMAVSILVGQYLGRDEADLAQKISKRGIHLAYFYILPLIILLVVFPDIFIKAFNIEENNPEFAKIYDMLVIILRFVAIYSLFDVINLVFAGTLKGAGDTNYILKIIGITSILVMVIPVYVSFSIFNASLYFGWSFVTLYVVVLGINFLIRFHSGKWKTKSVIREPNRFIVDFPEIPTPEI